ncbi:putative dynamin stalk domain, GTPase effector domain, Dynamin superfamily [Helianthus debilis subsp. tardiflorus]
MVTFIQIVGSLKETLKKILIQGEFDEYENDNEMHCDARLAEMVDKLSKDLQSSVNFSENFLVEEMQVLEEANGIRLPNFLPRSVFLSLLRRKVNAISDLHVSFVNKVWDYLEIVCARVLIDRCGNYPQMLPSMKKATQHVMAKLKAMFVERVVEMIEMEKMTDYTCDPDFITSYNKLMNYHGEFSLNLLHSYTSDSINVEGYGSFNIGHLCEVSENTRNQAFDLKMRMAAYWNIVLKRMVDCLALQVRYFMQKMVNKEMEMEIVNEVTVHGGGIEKMLDEPPYVAKKRERLQSSISLLKESKEIIEQVMDDIAVTSY